MEIFLEISRWGTSTGSKDKEGEVVVEDAAAANPLSTKCRSLAICRPWDCSRRPFHLRL
jgi:hypothetical protein